MRTVYFAQVIDRGRVRAGSHSVMATSDAALQPISIKVKWDGWNGILRGNLPAVPTLVASLIRGAAGLRRRRQMRTRSHHL